MWLLSATVPTRLNRRRFSQPATHRALTIHFAARVGVCCLLGGCGHNQPSKDAIIGAISSAVPALYKIRSAEVDYNPTSDKSGIAKVKLQIAPKEDLFEASRRDSRVDEPARLDFDEDTNRILTRAKEGGVRVPAERLQEIDTCIVNRNKLMAKLNRPWYNVAAKSGVPVAVYGSVQASYEFKEWRFQAPRLDQDVSNSGDPKSALGTEPNIVGSTGAQELADRMVSANAALKNAIDHAETEVERLIAQKNDAASKDLASRKDMLVKACGPGTKYGGFYRRGDLFDSVSGPITIAFDAYDPVRQTVEVKATLGGAHAASSTFTGALVMGDGQNKRDRIIMEPTGHVEGKKTTFTGIFGGGTSVITLGSAGTIYCNDAGRSDVQLKKLP